jgi:hypothetical protein
MAALIFSLRSQRWGTARACAGGSARDDDDILGPLKLSGFLKEFLGKGLQRRYCPLIGYAVGKPDGVLRLIA